MEKPFDFGRSVAPKDTVSEVFRSSDRHHRPENVNNVLEAPTKMVLFKWCWYIRLKQKKTLTKLN